MRTPYPNELMHYGIKGQKWGIRRFQDEAGRLTEAGRKRYGILSDRRPGESLRTTVSRHRYERMAQIRKDSKRMSRMSKRQKQSLEQATRYWKQRSQGKKHSEIMYKRNFIKRLYDIQRSYSLGERAAYNGILNTAQNAIRQKRMNEILYDDNKHVGQVVASSLWQTAGGLLMDEIVNKVFGHF